MKIKSNTKWLAISFGLAVLLILGGLFSLQVPARAAAESPVANAHVSGMYMDTAGTPPTPTPPVHVDHSQFPILQQDFETGPDVTEACLSCHEEAANDIMHTTHWTWEFVNETTGQTLGKKTLINNFCISIQSNEPRCTSCHIGYGWKDKTFDFSVAKNVDCLVCHDTTGTYKKFPTAAGHPAYEPKEFPPGSGKIWAPPVLSEVAQNVGATSRQTCGACHFYGGGGNEVKHGDLDNSLLNPPYELDVHMSPEGGNFTCTTCHTTEHHEIPGSRYSWDNYDWQGCESCHTNAPHDLAILNSHTQKIACQTCHIPEFARGGIPTKMFWDWSKAGQMNAEGKPYSEELEDGWEYNTLKGEFRWEENVVPHYTWFNGQVLYTLAQDTVDPNGVVSINKPMGSIHDPNARITPFKLFTGVQPYDSISNTMVIPHLFGKDDTAYWGNFDWAKSIQAGMEYAGLPYSGEYGFIHTEMYWPTTHMVAPAKDALNCQDCHAENGRLDFVALGYTEDEATGLTHFPPTAHLGNITTSATDPETCSNCHADEYDAWANSTHGEKSVGCVSCHYLEGTGEHPKVAYTVSHDADVCGACHLKEYDDWKNSVHANPGGGKDAIACTDCHNPHTQSQMITAGNQTSCESCHKEQAGEMPDSTHAAEGLTCLDCHKNTEMNSGHTFKIASDTCVSCHGENAHSANELVTLMGETTPAETEPTEETAESTSKQTGNIQIGMWAYLLVGLVVGGAGYWVIAGKDPGIGAEVLEKAQENADSDQGGDDDDGQEQA